MNYYRVERIQVKEIQRKRQLSGGNTNSSKHLSKDDVVFSREGICRSPLIYRYYHYSQSLLSYLAKGEP